MDLRARDSAGDRHLPRAAPADHAVGGNRELQRHFGPLQAGTSEIAGEKIGGFIRQNALDNLDAGVAQDGVAAPRDARVGIAGGTDDAGDAGGDQRLGARGRAAMMGAGFERDIGGGAARPRTGLGQRLRFGMGTAANGGDAAADDDAVADDQRADGGVGGGQTQIAARQADGGFHEAAVGPGRH
jgi:hypothetical protein